VISFSRSF